MPTTNWHAEYNALVKFTQRVLDQIHTEIAIAEESTKAFREAGYARIAARCLIRVQTLEDCLTLWEETPYE